MSPNEKDIRMTVIVPVYNEAECLDRFQLEMDHFLAAASIETTVLFVDDGSTDQSVAIITSIHDHNPSYDFIALKNNSGLSTALKAGIDFCQTPLLGYIDADLQTLPNDFSHMLQYLPEYDMINGIRMKRHDKWIKKLSSKIANTYRKTIIGDGIQDTCCPLKIIKTKYAKRIPFFSGMHRFLPAMVQYQGGKVKQIPVRHFPRYAGTAKYNLRNRLVGPFIDTFAVIWMKRRYICYHLEERSKCVTR
jgi:glycosyltransferase involved in cell wall biosynthesis